jgi:hypothetical protein
MRRALVLSIHIAHVALLLITALDDARHRRSAPQLPTPIVEFADASAVPDCPMPVWRPDPNVRYAAMVIRVDPIDADRRAEAAPCVNSYAHAAAPR